MEPEDDLFKAAERAKPKKPKTFWISSEHLQKLQDMLLIAPEDKKEKVVDRVRRAIHKEIDEMWRLYKAIGGG